MKNSTKDRYYEIIFESDTRKGKLFDILLLIFIVLSILIVALDSVDSVREQFGNLLRITAWVITIAFTLEYILRIWVVRKHWRYISSFYGIIDLLAILPTFLGLIFTGAAGLVVIRALRLLRVFRILKLNRYSNAALILRNALKASLTKISVFLFTILMVVIIVGTIMYLMTGERPKELKDYFFPKTGNKTPDGADERLSLPTYAKDVYSYATRPVETLKNKEHPFPGLVNDLITNKDFFNTEISTEGDPLLDQMLEKAEFIKDTGRSFSFKTYEKLQAVEDNPKKNAFVSFSGITSAPNYLTRSKAQKLMYRMIAERIPDNARSKKEFAKYEYKKQLKNRMRKGEPIDRLEAIDILGKTEFKKTQNSAKLPPFADSFRKLTLEDALNVYAIGTARERDQVRKILRKKYRNAHKKDDDIKDMYKDLMDSDN